MDSRLSVLRRTRARGNDTGRAFLVKVKEKKGKFWSFLRYAKDSFIIGAGDDDPGGIATYAQVGAVAGLSQLWLIALSTPMLIAVQEMSMRIGVVTKKGLSAVLKENFGFRLSAMAAVIVLICNVATIGADIAAISEATQIFTGVAWQWFVLPVCALILFLLIKGKYKQISKFLFILTPLLLCYVVAGLLANLNWFDVLKSTVIPKFEFNLPFWTVAVGLLGTTISPYLIYWQTTEEVEDRTQLSDIKKEAIGVRAGMVYSNFVSFFIIVCASLLYSKQGVYIDTAAEAARALRPLAGDYSSYLFAFGIIAAGILAIPILSASAAYALSEIFNWREGLDKKLKKAEAFYLVIIAAIMAGALMALFGIEPMKMLLYSQVLNGVLCPILILLLLIVCNRKKIMGPHKNGWFLNIFGSVTIIVMVASSLLMLISYLFNRS